MTSPAPVRVAPRALTRGLSFSTRMLLQQLLVLGVVVLLATGVYGWLSYQRLNAEVGAKSLAVAQSLAEDPGVRAALAAGTTTPDPATLAAGPVQRYAEVVRKRTTALFVVVTDRQGIRWSHPNPALLGQRVSTSPDAALAGDEVTIQETGTLGPSVRSKVPIRSGAGTIVGEVSVGYSTDDVKQALFSSIGPVLVVGVAALLLGALGSTVLGRKLRRHTLGLEPEEIGALVQDQEVVLHGVEEGVLGIAPDGVVTVCNGKAQRLLELEDPVGSAVADLPLPAALLRVIGSAPANDGDRRSLQIVAGDSVLLVSARRVHRGRHDLGWVVMVRDRTDVEALTRQLDAVGSLSAALRAQRHEFANRLHTVSGLLETGNPGSAADYLRSTLETGPLKYPLENAALLTDTYLLAFLGAKSLQAAEKGVRLRIGAASAVHAPVADAQNATTVLGNLLDNAITAAVQGTATDRWVEVELFSDGTHLHLTVSDSGDGVAAGVLDILFTEGGSGQEPVAGVGQGEGLGLALSRQLARLDGGDVWLLDAGTEGGPGAVFAARLHNVLENLSEGNGG